MEIKWIAVEGTQAKKPDEVDAKSSPCVVYLRRNITQIEKESGDQTVLVWKYEEAKLTLAEYAEYQKELAACGSLSQKELVENNLVLMEAIADTFEQQMALQENQLVIMEAIADLYESMQ
jgi:hypothetical protein